MPPKEKAHELMMIFEYKPYALKCIDEILSLFVNNKYDSRYEYYQQVKEEIINL